MLFQSNYLVVNHGSIIVIIIPKETTYLNLSKLDAPAIEMLTYHV